MSWWAACTAFALAAAITFIVTPLAIALARATNFYDVPAGYKDHGKPTPYLGGLAVFVGFLVSATLLGEGIDRFGVVIGCAAGLLAIGMRDDRASVRPAARVAAEVAAGVALFASGQGWDVFSSEVANLALTLAWVVGLVNAFNLMDNLDGATTTVAGVAATGAGVLAATNGDGTLAVFTFALAGACLGFLPHNLADPARIFLGDGGSMPVGFLVAATTIAAAESANPDDTGVFIAAMLVGLVILDTTLVVVSRQRAGVPLVTAGRDHLTHRLLTRLSSPRRVAVALAVAQAVLCGLAIAAAGLGSAAVEAVAFAAVATGIGAITVLESGSWRPVRRRVATQLPVDVRGRPEAGLEPMVEPDHG